MARVLGRASPGEIPAALPATSAALLHLRVGDVLRLQDRNSDGAADLHDHRPVRATAAGGHRRRLLAAGLAARERVKHGERVHHLRAADRAAHRVSRLRSRRRQAPGSPSPTWRPSPTPSCPRPRPISRALETAMNNSNTLSGMQLTSNLPTPARRHRQQPRPRQVAAGDQRAATDRARGRRAARRRPAARHPARGRDRAAPRARRDPPAADRADGGRGRPAFRRDRAGRRGGGDLAGPVARRLALRPGHRGRSPAQRRHQPDGRGHLDGRARGHGPYRRARGRRAALPGAAARGRRQPGSGAAARPRSPASPGRAPTWP